MAQSDDPNAPDPTGATPPPAGGAPPAKKRWNNTAQWQDPYNPPSPGDPYWAEWIAANPDYWSYNGLTPPAAAAPAPTPSSGGPAPTAGAPPGAKLTPDGTWIVSQYDPGKWTDNQNQIWELGPDGQPRKWYQKAAESPTGVTVAGGPPTSTGNQDTGLSGRPAPYVSSPFGSPAFTPATWQGGPFVDPTMQEVQNTPGYQTRLDAGNQGIQRGAAAQGSVLNGGTQKALTQFGQDYATGEYQTARGNAYQDYMSKYSQFQDQNAQGQLAYQNQYQQYLGDESRKLGDYITNNQTNRNFDLDYWSRLRDMYNAGANGAFGSYHPGS